MARTDDLINDWPLLDDYLSEQEARGDALEKKLDAANVTIASLNATLDAAVKTLNERDATIAEQQALLDASAADEVIVAMHARAEKIRQKRGQAGPTPAPVESAPPAEGLLSDTIPNL